MSWAGCPPNKGFTLSGHQVNKLICTACRCSRLKAAERWRIKFDSTSLVAGTNFVRRVAMTFGLAVERICCREHHRANLGFGYMAATAAQTQPQN